MAIKIMKIVEFAGLTYPKGDGRVLCPVQEDTTQRTIIDKRPEQLGCPATTRNSTHEERLNFDLKHEVSKRVPARTKAK